MSGSGTTGGRPGITGCWPGNILPTGEQGVGRVQTDPAQEGISGKFIGEIREGIMQCMRGWPGSRRTGAAEDSQGRYLGNQSEPATCKEYSACGSNCCS